MKIERLACLYYGSRVFKESATASTNIYKCLHCEHKHLSIQVNLNTGTEYTSLTLVGRNTKSRNALGDIYASIACIRYKMQILLN